MLNYFNSVMQDKALPKDLKIFINATNVKLDLNDNELEQLAEAHNNMFIKYRRMKIAFVVKAPTETALSILYKKLAENKRLKFNVFFTKEAANNWLESLI